MKKSRALRNWALATLIFGVLAAVLLVVFTLVSSLGTDITRAAAWAPSWVYYLSALVEVLNPALWWGCASIYLNIAWYVILALVVIIFIVLLIVGGKRRCKAIIGAAFIELAFGIALAYAYLLFFAGNHGTLSCTHEINAAIKFIIKNALAFNFEYVWYYVEFCGLALLGLGFLICWIGTFIAALARKCEKREPIAAPVAEDKEEEPVAAAEPKQKKTGVLLVRAYDKYYPTSRLVEKRDADYPHEPLEQKPLTADEIRQIMRDELERRENEKIIEEYKNQKQAERIAAEVVKAQEANRKPEPAPALAPAAEPKPAPAPVKAEEPKAEEDEVVPTPIVFASPVVVKEEAPAKKEKKEPKKEGLTEDQVKSIIADEIAAALKDFVVKVEKEVKVVEVVKEVPVEVVKEVPVEVIKEVPVEVVKEVEPAPVEEPKKEEPVVVASEEPAPAPVEEVAPVQEEQVAPQASEEVVVIEEVEPAPAEEVAAPAIVRIPFTTRILEADEDIKAAFNHFKSLLKSYGLNDRVSNGGDTFRLHKVTYCKITMAGKSLKLYLALNPEDYKETKLPIKDASSKAMYAEIPLVFKVKSGLSVRRAEDLIRDCMDKHGLEQIDRVQEYDWVSEIANAVVEDDGQEEDED